MKDLVRPLSKKRSFRTSFDSHHVTLGKTKHLWKMSERNFIIFFQYSEGKWFGKYLRYWSLKSQECLLKHRQSITIILFGTVEFAVPYSNTIILKTKTFCSVFFFHLWNLQKILNKFEKRKIVIANVFPKLQTVKDLVRRFSKKRRFRTSFNSQHVKELQTLVKSAWEHLYHIFSSLSREMVSIICPWLKFEIIGVFVNTFTADYKYRFPECKNLPFPIEIQLS